MFSQQQPARCPLPTARTARNSSIPTNPHAAQPRSQLLAATALWGERSYGVPPVPKQSCTLCVSCASRSGAGLLASMAPLEGMVLRGGLGGGGLAPRGAPLPPPPPPPLRSGSEEGSGRGQPAPVWVPVGFKGMG